MTRLLTRFLTSLGSIVAVLAALAAGPLHAQTAARQVDVVIVLDRSGSMSGPIGRVKANVEAFVQSLDSSNLDAAYTLVRYGNGSNTDGLIVNSGRFYTDFHTFKTQALNPVVAVGGSAHGLDALGRTLQNLAWRSSALKTIILITDTYDEGSSTTAAAIQSSLLNGGYILHTVTSGTPVWETQRVATGGQNSLWNRTSERSSR